MKQYVAWFILFSTFSLGHSTTCSSSTQEVNVIGREQYYAPSIENMQIYRILYDSNAAWYYWGTTYSGGVSLPISNVSPVILKYDQAAGYIFSKKYAGNVSVKSFTLDKTATFIYFLLTDSNSWLLKVDATTGVITETVRTTNMQCSTDYCDMEFSTSGDDLYMTMRDPSTSTAKICSYSLNFAVASNCVTFSSTDATYSIKSITNSQIYTVTTNSVNKNMMMFVYDFSSDTFQWSKEAACSSPGTCVIQQADAVYDSTNDQIIAFNVYNNVGLMYFLNKTDGSLISDKRILTGYISYLNCVTLLDGQTVYLWINFPSTSTIVSVQLSDFTFEVYDINDVSLYDTLAVNNSQR